MGRRIKKKFQWIADSSGNYGAVPAVTGKFGYDHETACGLFFNTRRAELRLAGAVADGVAGALSPHIGIYQAQADSPEEGEAIYNIARARLSSNERGTG